MKGVNNSKYANKFAEAHHATQLENKTKKVNIFRICYLFYVTENLDRISRVMWAVVVLVFYKDVSLVQYQLVLIHPTNFSQHP